MSPVYVGIIGLLVMLAVIACRVPIAWAIGVVGLAGVIYLGGLKSALAMAASVPYTTAASYVLSSIPMFVLMGEFLTYAGMGEGLFKTGYNWFGQLPGGLGISVVASSAVFAAASGSAVANAAAMGVIALPEMRKFGYDDAFSCGVIAGGGTLDILIPPSTAFIVYGMLTETSIGLLFIAGLFPGIIMALIMICVVYIRARLNPRLAPGAEVTIPWAEKLRSLLNIVPIVILFLLVIGGLYGGIFTATEGGAMGALGTFILAAIRRRVNKKMLLESMQGTLRVTCMMFAILIGGYIFAYFSAMSRLPAELTGFVIALHITPMGVLVCILLVLLVAGCFIDAGPLMIIFVPLFHPLVVSIGFNPYLFGVLVVIMVEVGLITPPVGLVCFVLNGVTGVPLSTIFRGIWPMLIAQILTIPCVLFFPSLALWHLAK